ncbi:MAG TPA: glutathione S-transferase family protein [Burkholderiales bacterium]|nr:glutathione S-transferase family protein [Burkholderiales bacterium]
MLRLCGFRISNYHNKVRLALLEKGIAHEEDDQCRPSQKPEWLVRSPLGKVPILELDGGRRLAESEVICEYLEDTYPEKPLLPREPYARAKVRELVKVIELHTELHARRLYGMVFFGRPVDERLKGEVEPEIAKGARALKKLAKFGPYIAGAELTLADCAAFVSLPIVSLATKGAYGRDFLGDLPELKPYLKMLGERPAFARVQEDRKAASAAAAAQARK